MFKVTPEVPHLSTYHVQLNSQGSVKAFDFKWNSSSMGAL